MARGEVRIVTQRYKGKPFPLWIATVRDAEGRIVWSDNSGLSPKVHFHLMTEAARICKAVATLEEKGNVPRWTWNEVVHRAARSL